MTGNITSAETSCPIAGQVRRKFWDEEPAPLRIKKVVINGMIRIKGIYSKTLVRSHADEVTPHRAMTATAASAVKLNTVAVM